ncbi:MAG: glycosyltransferase family 87 protein [Actinomycetes bacterium]
MSTPRDVTAPSREQDDPDIVLPSRDDPFLRASCEAVGGVAGRHVRSGTGWWTPVRTLVALTLLVAGLGVLSKTPCHQEDWPRAGTLQYVHACYSDVPHLFRERGLADGDLPYLDSAVEYPVLTGAVMGATAQAALALADVRDAQATRFFDVNALLFAALAVVTVLGVAALSRRRPWDAALVALSPVLALTATINWDMLAVALTTLAMLAWARRRPVLAGVLLGLAVSAKFYPVVLLGPLFLLALRAGRLHVLVRTVAAAVAAWLAVNLPVVLVAPDAWAEFYTFSERREASFGSPWYWYTHVVGPLHTGTVNLLGTLTFGVLALGIAVLALSAPARPRLAQVAFLTVAAFCLTNKVYSPQFALWLLPLAALARPRWRDLLAWQACEVLYFLAVWYHLASFTDTERGLPDGAYWVALWLHVAGTLVLAGLVVRDVLRPDLDPVRAEGVDDPAGGVLDGAPDAVAWGR